MLQRKRDNELEKFILRGGIHYFLYKLEGIFVLSTLELIRMLQFTNSNLSNIFRSV